MKKTTLLVFLSVASAIAQPQTGTAPILAGVDLPIGMGKEAALVKLAVAPNTRMHELGDDWYEVITRKSEVWSGTGDIVFRGDKVTRICLYLGGSQQTLSSIAEALYAAVGVGRDDNSAKAWSLINSYPDPPVHEVHLMFADREVVVSFSAPESQQVVSVQVYFPRVLATKTPAPAK